MRKKLVVLGGVALAICAAHAREAEAKLIRYEINGKRYSYSTNNHQQTREARQRIDAANVAAAAKARADAELATNPLVKIFGSRTQREAADAQSRLEQNLGRRETTDLESTSSVKRRRAEPRRSKRAYARAERKRSREARVERRSRSAPAQKRAALAPETYRANSRKAEPKPSEAQTRIEPAPKLPVIERTQVSDGQPAKNAAPAKVSDDSVASSLMDFVNQVRKALP
jgi:hypothetical protein